MGFRWAVSKKVIFEQTGNRRRGKPSRTSGAKVLKVLRQECGLHPRLSCRGCVGMMEGLEQSPSALMCVRWVGTPGNKDGTRDGVSKERHRKLAPLCSFQRHPGED